MHNPPRSVLTPMVAKLEMWGPLSSSDKAAILELPHRVVTSKPHSFIITEGEKAHSSCLLLSGYCCRHRTARSGERQVLSIHMKGDVIDVQGPMLAVADHSLETFHSAEVALIPVEAIGQIAFERPAVGRAMWSETLVDAAISREWILNVGRHDAKTRAAHFLCELSVRVERAGLGERCNYQLPMTQEQLADCLGLTSVHTNRVLMRLGEEGLITRTHRSVRVDDWSKLARAGEFDAAYLHLPSA